MSTRITWEVYVVERRSVHKATYPGKRPFCSLWHQIRVFRNRDNAVAFLQSLPKRETVDYFVEYQIATYCRVRMHDEDKP